MTLICVPIMVEDEPSAMRDALLAAEFGADLVEFRVDSFFTGTPNAAEHEPEAILRLVKASTLPCIVTCRPVQGGEGGHYDGAEDARVSLFERLGSAHANNTHHPPRYIDVELAAYTRSANFKQKVNLAVQHPAQVRDLRTSLILSSHDFHGRPPDLLRRIAAMRDQPAASILKIAYRARSLRDNLELFDLMRESDRPMIALGMGEFGLMSRVLAPKFGGFLTFAALRPASTTAPGQPTVDELLTRYRFRSIKPSTRVFGVIGWPVSHSISPDVHNAGFEAIGEWEDAARDNSERTTPIPGTKAGGVYLPLPVPPEYEHFKATLSALIDHPHLRFSGCSVTIPHKEHLVRFALEHCSSGHQPLHDDDGRAWFIDPACKLSGAANTLVVNRDASGRPASFDVWNFDAEAAVSAIKPHAWPLHGREVVIFGAGGVARALACRFLLLGANVSLCNRSPDRAASVANELNTSVSHQASLSHDNPTFGVARAAATPDLPIDRFPAVIINCTPLGMKGGPDPSSSPISAEALLACIERADAASATRPVVMDTVYNPVHTPLLTTAQSVSLTTIDGLSMFVRQAQMQFGEWTRHTPPPDGLFQEVAASALDIT